MTPTDIVCAESMTMPDGRCVGLAMLRDGTFFVEFVRPDGPNGDRMVTPIRLSRDALDVLVALYLKSKGVIL